jgi:ligand-binding sensor domain-containing protein/signal transduction histidine kinase
VLFLVATVASAELLPIRSYGVVDGLAEDGVIAIVSDARGFLWFVTPAGISEFDGYRFTTWDDQHGPSYRGASALVADPAGNYWVGTSEGLRRFGKEGPAHFETFLPDSEVHRIALLLRARSGRLFAATGFELFVVGDGLRMAKIPLPTAITGAVRISALAEDHVGSLWVAAAPMIEILDPRRPGQAVGRVIGLPAGVSNINAMVEAPADCMWLATNRGLVRLERRAGETDWRFRRLYGVRDGLAATNAGSLLRASDGVVWVGTTEGISRFSESDAVPRFRNLGTRQGLTASSIMSLAEDGAGNIWTGAPSGGVMRIRAYGFTTFQKQDGLLQPALIQVLEDRQGSLMTVSDTGAAPPRVFTFFDGHTFHQGVPRALAYTRSWVWQRMLLESTTGDWWAATGRGLCRFPPGPATALLNNRPVACYTDEGIFHIFEDSRGNIWASAPADRLLRWNRDTGRVAYVRPDGSDSATPCAFGDLVGAMAEDRGGNVWLGLWAGGLCRYAGGRIVGYRNGETAPRGAVYALHVDSSGRLWIACNGGGLSVMADPTDNTPRLVTYDISKGMGTNLVRSIVEDRFGRIWAGTARGVVCLDPKTGVIRRFSAADGLPQGSVTGGIRDRSGALWFAAQGLARIVPQAPGSSPGSAGSPAAVLTGIRIAGEEYPVSVLGENRIRQVVLAPGRNHVEIEFAAPGNPSEEDLRYRFMLEGADSGWSAPQAEHRVDYRNLRAGSYRFLVKTVNLSGVDSASAAEFDFRILPPFWLRWWFLLSAALAFLSAAYWLHRVRVAHLVAIERMRTEIATDLHDDIGASLARIAILSDVARVNLQGSNREQNPEASAAPMARIGGMARELLDSLNDIVWSIRAADANVESLVSRMREFALDVLAQGETSFLLQCDEGLRSRMLSPDTRRHLLLIFKECIHNIAQHSGCTSACATLHAADGRLIMSVSDNGRGAARGNGSTHRGNGTPSMMRRARAMRGEIEFGNNPAGGYRVVVRIPLPPAGMIRAWRQ